MPVLSIIVSMVHGSPFDASNQLLGQPREAHSGILPLNRWLGEGGSAVAAPSISTMLNWWKHRIVNDVTQF
jgi:hypothetical protein